MLSDFELHLLVWWLRDLHQYRLRWSRSCADHCSLQLPGQQYLLRSNEGQMRKYLLRFSLLFFGGDLPDFNQTPLAFASQQKCLSLLLSLCFTLQRCSLCSDRRRPGSANWRIARGIADYSQLGPRSCLLRLLVTPVSPSSGTLQLCSTVTAIEFGCFLSYASLARNWSRDFGAKRWNPTAVKCLILIASGLLMCFSFRWLSNLQLQL